MVIRRYVIYCFCNHEMSCRGKPNLHRYPMEEKETVKRGHALLPSLQCPLIPCPQLSTIDTSLRLVGCIGSGESSTEFHTKTVSNESQTQKNMNTIVVGIMDWFCFILLLANGRLNKVEQR
jgi:hypothetical protein